MGNPKLPPPGRKIAGPDPFEPLFSALDGSPDIAAKIAILIGSFALIERHTPKLLSRISGISEEDAATILGSFASFSYRIDLIESILATRDRATDDARAVTVLCKKIRSASSVRNRYVHSTFSGFRNTITATAYQNDSRKKPVAFNVIEHIDADLKSIKLAYYFLTSYVDYGELPP